MTTAASTGNTHSSIYVVGIDVGGTKIHAGLVDANGDIVAETTVPTHVASGADLASQLVEVIGNLADLGGVTLSQIVATGIGGAGVPNDTAGFDLAPNLSATENGLSEDLEAALGHPVLLENDVNVAAVGELHSGVGRESDNFVYVAVGTGIGMGIVANGSLVRGATGAAGEIGYLPIGADPFDERNHRRGPLEESLAGHTLADRYRLSTGRTITTREVFDRVAEDDEHAVAAVSDEAKHLALGLAAVNAVLNPEIIVLGGGVGSRPELLLPLAAWLLELGIPSIDVRLSELGHRAPVVGAARLALDHILAPLVSKGLTR
ncbi:ROK family protein [Microbacterium sp. NPDC076768]|uniref:ROK family protein n=1 Tax=Microbacterium sp. NPDC076768 TaxID=3154858 RepID=UPI00344A3F46